ncbi:MAG: triosephosphate isomerase [Candidatus Aenigmarchaeota archaeon]|nr:triosephosphate isomerase [Candidatus Aenigmarchaeota archaeon]
MELIINCKAYEPGMGKHAVTLARTAIFAAKKYNIQIALAVQPQDIMAVSATGIPTFAQHIDAIKYGAHTGSISPCGVKKAGAQGTLLNHSERKLSPAVLQQSILLAKKAGLFVIACAATPTEAKQINSLNPDVIVVEPPELIGTNTAVSQAKPDVITKTIKAITTPVLCGAGIRHAKDVRKALELGAKGILVSSAIVQAQHPDTILAELANEFREFRKSSITTKYIN